MQRSLNRITVYSTILFVVILTAQIPAKGQVISKTDIEIIANKKTLKEKYHERVVKYGFGKKKSVSNILFAPPLYVYQKFISAQISASCLYNPSCSEFSHRAFTCYSFPKAFLSSIDRIMRCDRLSAIDIPKDMVDPVSHKKNEDIDYYGNIE
ncbi:MAG TPA: membrane protein insertion efficiency factor YidD [Tenuifilaceae bacterium]|nr:membrane protein insertion efficiency factor YidD [Tenuifilaceae bacterium]HPE17314.1 membrane protein insertion efficiency factor YidD [Tenuifilaceae bacterium]HPJ44540.1 membrane protein insertion efficiency factor YidD [Tenuifilaceae bacterium]HPQ33078.1 membrane protein insertion efficiency factor YidD [Tenuifilaceae bacterium]HRX67622.1 membrane protein insertion efficiency factor YidD [Tenuifilaceae bacterium]